MVLEQFNYDACLTRLAACSQVGMPCWLQLQRVSTDGTALVGLPQRLIREDAAWEGRVIEAPYLVLRKVNSYR